MNADVRCEQICHSSQITIKHTIDIQSDIQTTLQRSRPTRGATIRRQTTPANRDHLDPDSPLFVSATTKPIRRPEQTQLLLFQMAGYVHPNPCHDSKYPCHVCTRNVTSRGVSYQYNRCSGWVHEKCSGLLNAAQYRRMEK